ncbi:MAG TPA: DUF2231 domain-containing protein, partial [Acidobacteriaceae bacterium]|nr:DUF2231 domain-containing protein [Acidobacteriaceae bacterium]
QWDLKLRAVGSSRTVEVLILADAMEQRSPTSLSTVERRASAAIEETGHGYTQPAEHGPNCRPPTPPMLIPFPVAFLVATFVCDVVFWKTGNPAWSTASLYLLGAALIMATLAALAGVTDFMGDSRIRDLSAAWHHMIGNVVAVLLALWNWYRRFDQGDAAVLPLGLLISLIVVLILLYTGWRGWEMIYKHRVAVSDEVL